MMIFVRKKNLNTKHMCSIRYIGRYIGERYGEGAAYRRIWLVEVECTGRETDFTQCRHNGWERNYCTTSAGFRNDVSISCSNSTASTGPTGKKFHCCCLCQSPMLCSSTSVAKYRPYKTPMHKMQHCFLVDFELLQKFLRDCSICKYQRL